MSEKRSFFIFNLLKPAALAATAALLASCGNVGKASRQEAGSSADRLVPYTPATSGGRDTSGCPSRANVLPDYDWHLNGSMQFTACSKASDAAGVTIKGVPYAGDRICVFPAQQVSETQILPKPDLADGFPLYSCAVADAYRGTSFSFAGVNYNFVFVVAERDAIRMRACLFSGLRSDCPVYRPSTFSRGRFR